MGATQLSRAASAAEPEISEMETDPVFGPYEQAYQDMIRNTATKHSPWYVVPADNKLFTRVVVAAVVVDTLVSLDVAYPEVDNSRLLETAQAKKALLKQK